MVDLAVGGVDCGPDHFLEKCAPALSISPFTQPRRAADAAMKLIAALPVDLNRLVPVRTDPKPAWQRWYIAGFCSVLAVGIFLRLPSSLFSDPASCFHRLEFLHPQAGFIETGFDEHLYRGYVNSLIRTGVASYYAVVDHYIEVQQPLTGSILPPVRFLYIFAAYLWHLTFGTEALGALHGVASLFSILTLLLSGIFAWRLGGRAAGLGVIALMSSAPTQIHMSQHALVDGFFTFWAVLCLWLLWENLRAPRSVPWLVAYSLGLMLLVITKENSVFVLVALVALLIANRWLKFGSVTRELLTATVLGPLLGIAALVLLAGGIDTLIATYKLSVAKNYTLNYAILTGDGPWHRYLVDLLLVSPVILLLAVGNFFRLNLSKKPELYVGLFIAASYAVMCNIKYGMNLRYANMWDMPLRFLALSALVSLIAPLRRYRSVVLGVAVALICAIELRQYIILAVQFPLYELVPEGLLRALHILKSH
jgi:4-amino-4-deoxy-L-arabinose transferase-like glycosyltransferase